MSKLQDKLTSNPHFIALYSEGMAKLFESGIFEILREFGAVQPLDRHKHRTAVAEAFRSSGYNAALDDLINFKERFVPAIAPQQAVTADFGGVSLALAKNNLTPQEADEYRKSRRERK